MSVQLLSFSIFFLVSLLLKTSSCGINKKLYFEINRFRIAEAFIFQDLMKAKIEFFITNDRLFKTIDNICGDCNLGNEILVMYNTHKYEYSLSDDKKRKQCFIYFTKK